MNLRLEESWPDMHASFLVYARATAWDGELSIASCNASRRRHRASWKSQDKGCLASRNSVSVKGCSRGPSRTRRRLRERVDLKSPVRENRPPGSVRGASGNRRPYLDTLALESRGDHHRAP